MTGADRVFQCFDSLVRDIEEHDRTAESLNNVFRFRVDKKRANSCAHGTWPCTRRKNPAREGVELAEVAPGYLMLKGTCLGNAGARQLRWRLQDSQPWKEPSLKVSNPLFHTVTLRSPEFVRLTGEQWENTLTTTAGRDEEETDALPAAFTSVTSEEDPGLDEEEIMRSLVTRKVPRSNVSQTHLNRHFRPSSSSPAPNLEQLRNKYEMFPMQTCRVILAEMVGKEKMVKPAAKSTVLIARGDETFQNQSTLDVLFEEVERLNQEWVGNLKGPQEEESEECSLAHASRQGLIWSADDVLLKPTLWKNEVRLHDDPTPVTL